MWSRSLLRWLKAQTGGMSTKKLLALLLTLAMALSLCACGGSDSGGGTQPAPAGTSDGQAKDDPVQTQPVDTGILILPARTLRKRAIPGFGWTRATFSSKSTIRRALLLRGCGQHEQRLLHHADDAL